MENEYGALLLGELVSQIGDHWLSREPVRVWEMSGVERVRLRDGNTVIFKRAVEPFTDEARILDHVARHGLPVPALLASTRRHGVLGMLLEDLGEEAPEPGLDDAAAAAVAVHQIPPPEHVRILDQAALSALPGHAQENLGLLLSDGRWGQAEDITGDLEALAAVSSDRARDSQVSPFGLLHSEFHPTSLHRDRDGRWRLLDMARACAGPGLFDLASWHGTTGRPDSGGLWELLYAYVEAGGPESALADRAGLDAASWALGWHRLWIVDWYLEQAHWWLRDPAGDDQAVEVVRRHLHEARHYLHA